jgi:hypothetical protein
MCKPRPSHQQHHGHTLRLQRAVNEACGVLTAAVHKSIFSRDIRVVEVLLCQAGRTIISRKLLVAATLSLSINPS